MNELEGFSYSTGTNLYYHRKSKRNSNGMTTKAQISRNPSFQNSEAEPYCSVRCSCYNHRKIQNIDSNISQKSCSWRLNSMWHYTSRPSLTSLIMLFLLSLMCLLQPTLSIRSSNMGMFNSPNLDVLIFKETLDPDGAFVVEWTPIEDRIIFRVTVRTKGYIGFGLSSSGRMDGADIVVGWVHSGKAYLQDRHGKGNNDPLVDEQQDWMLVWGSENDTHTVLIMNRPYNTCDSKDHVISNDTVSLLWAYHRDDPVDPESPRPRLHYHGDFRGARSAFLLQRPPQHEPEEYLKPTNTWNLANQGVYVGHSGGPSPSTDASDTLYWCKIFKRPNVVQKNHIIKYEPVFTPGSQPHVHHMIVYECTNLNNNLEKVFEELSQLQGHECYQTNMSKYLYACNHVVVVWAVGSKGLSLPPEAGYPLTPNGSKFYMMETHYNVPGTAEEAFKDSSGVKVTYTSVLRNFDAGVLSVGLAPNWKHLIPPRQPTVQSQGHCVGECTERALPKTGINVFAVILHTHLLGRRVSVRHIRKGRELEPIAVDNNYDFNYQEYRALQRSRLVLPGDHLIGECMYNSMERTTITLGGFKTRDEKCLSFLFYWPRVDLSFCHSKPSLSTVLLSLGIHELSADVAPIKIKLPKELAGKTLEWRLQNYDWENHFQHFQEATKAGSFNQMCWKRGRSIYPELEKLDYELPNITDVWASQNVCPDRRNKNKKNRKRKFKNPRNRDRVISDGESLYNQHHRHHVPIQDGHNEDEDEFFDEDVMFDDRTDFKPIESIDVDPIHNFDVLLPVRDPINHLNNVHPEHFDPPRRDPTEDDKILKEEMANMERELERELERDVNRMPDSFQGIKAQQNNKKIDISSGISVNLVSASRTYMCISLCILLIWSYVNKY